MKPLIAKAALMVALALASANAGASETSTLFTEIIRACVVPRLNGADVDREALQKRYRSASAAELKEGEELGEIYLPRDRRLQARLRIAKDGRCIFLTWLDPKLVPTEELAEGYGLVDKYEISRFGTALIEGSEAGMASATLKGPARTEDFVLRFGDVSDGRRAVIIQVGYPK